MDDTTSSSASSPLINLSELDLMPAWVDRAGEGAGQVKWDFGKAGQRAERGDRGDRFGGGDRRGGRDDRGGRGFGGGAGKGFGGGGGGRSFGGGGFGGSKGFGGKPQGGPRGEQRGPRPEGGQRGPREGGPRPDGPRGGGQFRDDRGPRRGGDFQRGGGRGGFAPQRPMAPPPLPGWRLSILPEMAGVESLAAQIKATGRAYSLLDLAKLFLARRERYRVRFQCIDINAQPPKLIMCAGDGSLWISRDEAKAHLTDPSVLEKYYKAEKVSVDPPKGVFSAVAVCGLSGVVLGPPNFHTYQRALVKLHQERFKDWAFDRWKSRVRIEKDEEKLKQWVESQSSQTHYTLITDAENPPVFKSADEALRHLMETQGEGLFVEAGDVTISGNIPFKELAPTLVGQLRFAVESQQRFPLQLIQELCRLLELQGLKFFKENKKEIFVTRSRPRPLDGSLHISERIRSIIEFIRTNPKSDYNKVVAGLRHRPGAETSAPMAESEAAATSEATEATETEATSSDETAAPVVAPAEETAAPVEAAASESTESASAEAPATGGPDAPTEVVDKAAPAFASTPRAAEDPEETAILQDLRWLVREGYVTEFANGHLRVVEPRPKAPQPQPKAKKEKKPKAESTAEAAVATEASAEGETVPSEETEEASTDPDSAHEGDTESLSAADVAAFVGESAEADESTAEEAFSEGEAPAAVEAASTEETSAESPANEEKAASNEENTPSA